MSILCDDMRSQKIIFEYEQWCWYGILLRRAACIGPQTILVEPQRSKYSKYVLRPRDGCEEIRQTDRFL